MLLFMLLLLLYFTLFMHQLLWATIKIFYYIPNATKQKPCILFSYYQSRIACYWAHPLSTAFKFSPSIDPGQNWVLWGYLSMILCTILGDYIYQFFKRKEMLCLQPTPSPTSISTLLFRLLSTVSLNLHILLYFIWAPIQTYVFPSHLLFSWR